MLKAYEDMALRGIRATYKNHKTNLANDLMGLRYALLKVSAEQRPKLIDLGYSVVKKATNLENEPAPKSEEEYKTKSTFKGPTGKDTIIREAGRALGTLGVIGYEMAHATKSEEREQLKKEMKEFLKWMSAHHLV